MKTLDRLKAARIQLTRISLRDALATSGPLVALVLLAFALAWQFVEPAPPAKLVFTTGTEEGAYHAYAQRYREILARDGIDLELRPSAGSVANLERLADAGSGVGAGFVQSGTGAPEDYPDILSLGSAYYEPAWIFYRGPALEDQLRQLRGRRIAVGPIGSGTRKLATQLLLVNEAWSPPTRILDLGGEAAARALRQGRIDVALLIGPPETPVIRSLLNDPAIRLMSFDRAIAYTKAFPHLSAVRLPEGSINLVRNVPSREITLLAPTAQVVVRADLHPALSGLLLQAMTEVHGKSGIFQRTGEFPSPREQDFALSPQAQRYFKSGPSFLQRYLPFWAAILIDRIVVLLVPLIAVLIPAIRLAPVLYNWRIRSRIYRWYGELKILELELKQRFDGDKLPAYLAQLDDLERRAYLRPLPVAFTADVYTLRQHIDMVRRSLQSGSRPA